MTKLQIKSNWFEIVATVNSSESFKSPILSLQSVSLSIYLFISLSFPLFWKCFKAFWRLSSSCNSSKTLNMYTVYLFLSLSLSLSFISKRHFIPSVSESKPFGDAVIVVNVVTVDRSSVDRKVPDTASSASQPKLTRPAWAEPILLKLFSSFF